MTGVAPRNGRSTRQGRLLRHYCWLTHEGAAQAPEALAAARTLVTWAADHSKITDQIQ